MFEFEELLAITKNKLLFEKISEAKKRFTHIFAEAANQIPIGSLSKAHQHHRGIKISKGNELHHCPYQVLDVFRDFDMSRGCNIRILHWWGRGLFVLLFFGKNHPCLSQSQKLIDWASLHDYQICLDELWAYGKIIDEKKVQESKYYNPEKISTHLTTFSHLQLIKSIPLSAMETPGNEIKKEVDNILYWMLPC